MAEETPRQQFSEDAKTLSQSLKDTMKKLLQDLVNDSVELNRQYSEQVSSYTSFLKGQNQITLQNLNDQFRGFFDLLHKYDTELFSNAKTQHMAETWNIFTKEIEKEKAKLTFLLTKQSSATDKYQSAYTQSQTNNNQLILEINAEKRKSKNFEQDIKQKEAEILSLKSSIQSVFAEINDSNEKSKQLSEVIQAPTYTRKVSLPIEGGKKPKHRLK